MAIATQLFARLYRVLTHHASIHRSRIDLAMRRLISLGIYVRTLCIALRLRCPIAHCKA
jgi:hypothetical protein